MWCWYIYIHSICSLTRVFLHPTARPIIKNHPHPQHIIRNPRILIVVDWNSWIKGESENEELTNTFEPSATLGTYYIDLLGAEIAKYVCGAWMWWRWPGGGVVVGCVCGDCAGGGGGQVEVAWRCCIQGQHVECTSATKCPSPPHRWKCLP